MMSLFCRVLHTPLGHLPFSAVLLRGTIVFAKSLKLHHCTMEEEEAYFYGAPGAFPTTTAAGSHQLSARGDGVEAAVSAAAAAVASTMGTQGFSEETLEMATKLMAEAFAKEHGTITTKPPGPSWAKVAAAPAGKNAKIVSGAPQLPSAETSRASESSAGSSVTPAPVDNRQACVFFLNGSCRYGGACRFRHERPKTTAVEYFQAQLAAERVKAEIAPVFPPISPTKATSGAIPATATTTTTAPAVGSEEEFASLSAAWQESALEKKGALVQGAVDAGAASTLAEAETALQVAERSQSADVACGICFEHVMEKQANARFGLLTGCVHAFCLDCIRQWRARIDLPNDTIRACPLCRTVSYFVVPCDRYVTDEARKAAINGEYHTSQRVIPCRYFDNGRGTCPFGSSCWYAHTNPDGTAAAVTKPAVRVDGEGAVSVSRAFKLNELMGMR